MASSVDDAVHSDTGASASDCAEGMLEPCGDDSENGTEFSMSAPTSSSDELEVSAKCGAETPSPSCLLEGWLRLLAKHGLWAQEPESGRAVVAEENQRFLVALKKIQR